MGKTASKIFIALAVTVLFAASAYAEAKFNYGATERLRHEYWGNAFDLNDLGVKDESFIRLKSSIWGSLAYGENLGAYLKLTNEARYYFTSRSFPDNEMVWDEVVFDNLYVDLKKLANNHLDFRLGRQDFLFNYGESFLIGDGTPVDGSRTFYFNAARATIRFNDNHSLDIVGLTDPKEDDILPSLHEGAKRQLNTSDETGFFVYGKNKITKDLTLEPYYIYKIEDAFGKTPELKINTVGARVVYQFNPWKFRGEYAYQWGDYDGGRDRTGNGGYAFITRKFEDVALKPEADLGFVYLSGDDQNTIKNEAFDPLFSRFPWLSELYVFTLATETGIVAYWSNLEWLRANLKLALSPQSNLNLWYNYIWAAEKTSGLNPAMFSNDGKNRGQLLQGMISYAFNKNLDAYFLVEYFLPGNFYVSNSDNAIFTRVQVQYKF